METHKNTIRGFCARSVRVKKVKRSSSSFVEGENASGIARQSFGSTPAVFSRYPYVHTSIGVRTFRAVTFVGAPDIRYGIQAPKLET